MATTTKAPVTMAQRFLHELYALRVRSSQEVIAEFSDDSSTAIPPSVLGWAIPAPKDPTPVDLRIPATITALLPPPGTLTLYVVGAGGTGARIPAMAIKLLRRGDRLIILDPDTVEQGNLLRQHFTERHVGRPKAEVVAQAIAPEAARIGVEVVGLQTKLEAGTFDAIVREGNGLRRGAVCNVWLGCVDNREARAFLYNHLFHHFTSNSAYIDAGNELRGGQVILNLIGWPVRQLVTGEGTTVWDAQTLGTDIVGNWPQLVANTRRAFLRGLAEIVPELLRPAGAKVDEADAANACPIRIDGQSLPANVLASSYIMTMLSWLLDEIPFSLGGIFYSTQGTARGVPILTAHLDGELSTRP